MVDIIDFPGRPQGRCSYIDYEAIARICEDLEQEVGAIVIGSQAEFDAVDPLAYQINAHLIAIREALTVVKSMEPK